MRLIFIMLFAAQFLNAQSPKLTKLEMIALDEGIDSRALYKFRKANLKLTKQGPADYPYSYYDVPVISNHRTHIKFKEKEGIRFYKTIPEMYQDACKFFYANGKFLIPEHEKANGEELKFKPDKVSKNGLVTVCTKSGCTVTYKPMKDEVTLIEEEIDNQKDIILNIIRSSDEQCPFAQGYDLFYIETLTTPYMKICDLSKERYKLKLESKP